MSNIDTAALKDVSGQLHNEGYAIVRNVLTPEQIDTYKTEAYRIFDEETAAAAKGLRKYDADYLMYADYGDHIFNLVRKTRVFDELYENPIVLSVLEQTMKEKFILTQTEMRRPRQNMPEGSANAYHRDGRILVDADLWVIAFWVLEDVTDKNGPTIIIPRSHKHPVDMETEAANAVTLLANAGDLVFMNANTLHQASNPKEDSSRWVLIFSYNQWFLKPAVDHTRLFTRDEVAAMSPKLRELFGFTSLPPSDERKRMYTCRPWEEVSGEFVFKS